MLLGSVVVAMVYKVRNLGAKGCMLWLLVVVGVMFGWECGNVLGDFVMNFV